jgi:hypothetical protein
MSVRSKVLGLGTPDLRPETWTFFSGTPDSCLRALTTEDSGYR